MVSRVCHHVHLLKKLVFITAYIHESVATEGGPLNCAEIVYHQLPSGALLVFLLSNAHFKFSAKVRCGGVIPVGRSQFHFKVRTNWLCLDGRNHS